MPKPKRKSPQAAATAARVAAAAPSPTPVAVWSNNKACNKTWWWLNFLKQIDAAFPGAGTIKLKQLAYWDDTASAEEQEAEAAGLADMMIKGFTQLNGAHVYARGWAWNF